MSDGFCAYCGTPRVAGGSFCVRCGRPAPGPDSGTTDPFAVPGPFEPPTEPSDRISPMTPPVGTSSRYFVVCIEAVAVIGMILVFLSESRGPTFWEQIFGVESAAKAVFVGTALPALLVIAPRMIPSHLRGSGAPDARLSLMASVSGLLVGCRSLSGLIGSYDFGFSMNRGGLYEVGLGLGLAGFAVFALNITWNKGLKLMFTAPTNPIAPIAGILAASVFLWCRYALYTGNFVFSPASVSGPTDFEFIFLIALVAAGFMKTPFRQSVAFVLGTFSILSFLANVLISDAPLRPWPNPVTFACCVVMLFPFNEFGSKESVPFPRVS